MHCRACGYALWNLPEPRCPECGTAFSIRDYRFRPGTVGFACPHCGHLHGGVGERYLPALTDRALCLGCGQPMDVAAMRPVLLIEDLAKAEAASADVLPWEERKFLGFWPAWRQTWKLSMAHPSDLGGRLLPDRPWPEALWYAAATNLVTHVPVGLLGALVVLGFVVFRFNAGAGSMSLNWYVWYFVGLPAGAMVLAFLQPLAFVLFVGLPAHGFLALSGPRRGGVGLTLRAILYGHSPMIFTPILHIPPLCCCGMYLYLPFMVWPAILGIMALLKAQDLTPGRAVLAVLWFPAVLAILGGTLLFVAMLMS